MEDKDFQKKQERPSIRLPSTKTKPQALKRKEKLQEILWTKRNPPETIKGYNLRMCRKKCSYKKKRCWCCGLIYHLKTDFPANKEKQFNLLVEEL